MAQQEDAETRKKLELYQALLAKKRLRGLEDLYFFNKYIVETTPARQEMVVPHVHGEWSQWHKSSGKRVKMILVPRGTFKSTFFTVGYTLQQIAKDRNQRILLANATADNSRRFLDEIKAHLVGNETYKQLYSTWDGKDIPFYSDKNRWTQDEIVVSGRDMGVRESTVTAVGVGDNLVSQHYSLMICDDLVNLENSMTRLQSDKVIDWWKRAFSLLDYDGEMIIIGTRWAYYELYSYILSDEMLSKDVDCFIRGAYNEDGSLYFPEMLSQKKLDEIKGIQGSYIFSSFYLNNPVDEESALIRRDQIKYWTTERKAVDAGIADTMLPKIENMTIFTMCDPALSQEVWADASSIVTVGIDHRDNWYVLDIRRDKWLVQDLVTQLFAVKDEWHPDAMSIEVIGQAQSLMTPIRAEEESRRDYLPLTEIKARNNVVKEVRVRATLQGRFQRGKIFIQKGMYDLEDELMRFPKGDHDDILDCLSDLTEIEFPPDVTPGKEEYEGDSKFEEKIRELAKPRVAWNEYDPIMGEFF